MRRGYRIGILLLTIFLNVGFIVSVGYGVYAAYDASNRYGLAVMEETLFWPLFLASVLFLLGLFMTRQTYLDWSRGIVLYEAGIGVRSLRGLVPWHWNEIVSFKAGAVYGMRTYTLRRSDGKRLVLSAVLQDVDTLAAAIEEAIFPLLYERAAIQYNHGETIVFGALAVSKNGIRVGKKAYSWQEVGEVTLRRGILRISKKGGGRFGHARAVVSAIPNLRVLLSILDQVVGIKVN
ncbi:MAG: hypothetical protein NZL98_07790 [Anaerolineales bacterium]|nr:hypothetical protein [Anaerolineales bacterium]